MPQRKPNGLSDDTKTLITVLLLLFAYPAGLVMMFVWMKWPTWIKIIIALPVVILLIMFVIFLISLPFLMERRQFKQNSNKTIQLVTPAPLNYNQSPRK